MTNVSVEEHPRDSEGRFERVYEPGQSVRDRRQALVGKEPSPLSRLRDTAAKKAAVLLALEQTKGRKVKACRAANVCYKTVNLWLEEDEEFADKWFEVKSLYVEEVEDRLDAESVGGKGMPKVVATLAILNAEAPEKYKRPGDKGGSLSGELKVTVKLESQPLPQWEQAKQLPEGRE